MSFAKTLFSYIDKEAVLRVDGLQIGVRVLDARELFGRTDLLVTPLSGSGEQWVDAGRVVFS